MTEQLLQCVLSQQEQIHYPIMVHSGGSSFRGRGLLKVLQLLHQLITEAFLKHR